MRACPHCGKEIQDRVLICKWCQRNTPPPSTAEPPSLERAVRELHEFEDRMADFLRLASALTDRELQVALAKLADLHVAQPGSQVVQLKGQILGAYYVLRSDGTKSQSKLSRARCNAKWGIYLGRGLGERVLRELEMFPLPVIRDSTPSDYWTEGPFRARVRLLSP